MTEPVSFAVHSLPEPALAESQPDPRRKTNGRLKMLLVLAMCISPVVASYFTYFVIKPQGRTNYSDLISPSRDLPADLPLQDLSGKAVPALSLRGQWLMVVVAGSACDAACEKSLYLQRQLRETLGREKGRIDKVWFVTDGGTPRAEVMQAVGMGTPATVLRVPREALARWFTPATGQALEAHIYLVDPMGQWMMRAPINPDPAKLKRDVEKLLRASASWDLPGR
jgi:hypothetical protein